MSKGVIYSLQTFYKYKRIITQPTDKNASHRRVVNLSSHACVFCITAANFLQIQKHHSLNQPIATRARNPRFWMPLFGQKTGFRARNAGMNEIKSGIPCSDSNASHRRVVISCVCFCITACKLFTNTKASSLNQPIATQRIASPCCRLMRVFL
jgi:hypothetical protein